MNECNCGFRLHEESFYGSEKEVWCSLAYNLGFGKPHKKCIPKLCPIWQIFTVVTKGENNE